MYLDTAILVKLLVREPDSAFYVNLVDGQIAWSSQVILTECFSALLRKEREGAIASSHRKRAWKQVEADVSAHRMNLIAVDRGILVRANQILERCHPLVPLRSLDAIHLASAERSQSWPVASNDARLRQAGKILALSLCPLPPALR